MNEIISQRAFAKIIGVDESLIRKSIKQGKIIKGITRNEKGKPAIILKIAKKECEDLCIGMFVKLRREIAEQETEPDYDSMSSKELKRAMKSIKVKIDEPGKKKDKAHYALWQVHSMLFFKLRDKEAGQKKPKVKAI